MSAVETLSMLDRLLEPVVESMNPEFAARLVDSRTPGDIRAWIDRMAERGSAGRLSDEEASADQVFVQSPGVIGMMPRRARVLVSAHSDD